MRAAPGARVKEVVIRISGEANNEARSSLCDLSVETARFISYGKDKELH